MLHSPAPRDFDWAAPSPPGPAPASCWFDGLAPHPRLPLALRRESYFSGRETGDHRHEDFFALYAIRGGQALHIIDGEVSALTRGDVYILRAGATHAYRDFQNLQIDAFYFTLDVFASDELEALRELSGFWALFETPARNRFHLAPQSAREVDAQIETLRAEWTLTSRAAPLLLRAGFFRLLVTLARLQNVGANSVVTSSPVALAVRLMEENPAHAWSVPLLAARAFLSTARFSELFAREIGAPPATYLKRLRLERARMLLLESKLSATQIAGEVGFADAAHFSRAFRALYGMPPSSLRRRK